MSAGERELFERLISQYEAHIADLLQDKENLTGDKAALVKMLEMKDQQIDRFFSSERDTKRCSAVCRAS